MNEIACADCGEPVIIGTMCFNCGHRDETDWPYYSTGDEDADSDEASASQEWPGWRDTGGEG